MYRTGTGDCFTVKFFGGNTLKFTMMIDGGTWQGKRTHLEKYVKEIKKDTGGNIDLLVITHEHKDHVYLFESCKAIFKDFNFKNAWMAWTEEEDARLVKDWKEKYAQKKTALSLAADKIAEVTKDGSEYENQFTNNFGGKELFAARQYFSGVLNDFRELHVSESNLGAKKYVGGLKGMEIVKNELVKDKIKYCNPGEIIDNVEGLEGMKFYILGPPRSIIAVKKESGKKGSDDTYEHNKDLSRNDAFAAAMLESAGIVEKNLPFGAHYVDKKTGWAKGTYSADQENWRRVDNEWLFSAGNLALRMNSYTNNLSLVMAIEFEDSKNVMLFPGDAEFGSWESWHKIDWGNLKGSDNKHFTEDLLNRTIFYKMSHHNSHNGTAKKKGLKMMTHKDLSAMVTLDYDVISNGWKSTMPNAGILEDVLAKTKGRFMVMNEEGLFYDADKTVKLKDQIAAEKKKLSKTEKDAFEKAYKEEPLYLEFTVNGA